MCIICEIIFCMVILVMVAGCSDNDPDHPAYNPLTPEEEDVIIHKGTEKPFSGRFEDHYEKGTYTCKRCGTELFYSSSKFKSGCGWPSFDD